MRYWKMVLPAFAASILLLAGIPGMTQTAKRAPSPGAVPSGITRIAGTWVGVYKSNLVPPTKVTLVFQQFATMVTGTYLSANGAQGVMYGTSQASGAVALTADQKSPDCTGQFTMPVTRIGTTIQWKFTGTDCKGAEDGSGTATLQIMPAHVAEKEK